MDKMGKRKVIFRFPDGVEKTVQDIVNVIVEDKLITIIVSASVKPTVREYRTVERNPYRYTIHDRSQDGVRDGGMPGSNMDW